MTEVGDGHPTGANRKVGPSAVYRTSSGSDGAFVIEGVPLSRYTLRAERAGFLGEPVFVMPSGDIKAELKLAREAVITGRITDETGGPVSGVYLEVSGVYVGGAKTNDLGEYRLAGLRAGKFLLTVIPHPVNELAGNPEWVFQRTFYPGTVDYAEAKMIDVAEGAQLRFDLPLRRVRTFHVHGRVVPPVEADEKWDMSASINPTKASPFLSAVTHSMAPDRSFDFVGVLPGSYLLSASALFDGQVTGWRTIPLEVKERDLDGLLISFVDGVTIEGEVRTIGPPAEFKLTNFEVTLNSETSMISGSGRRMTPDGKFTLGGVPPGQFKIRGTAGGAGGYFQSIRYNRREVTDWKLDVLPDEVEAKL